MTRYSLYLKLFYATTLVEASKQKIKRSIKLMIVELRTDKGLVVVGGGGPSILIYSRQ